MEWPGRLLLEATSLTDESRNIIIAISDAAIALLSYVFLFRIYEKRQIKELSISMFGKNAITGFALGMVLQSLFILVIYMAGGYSIVHVNPVSFLLPSFATAFTAGVVAEVLIRGIFFRLTEEKFGTGITLIIAALIFAILHISSKGATFLSVFSTAMQAGILLSAAYVFSRSLWLPIFLHFSWDFAEPGIFGAINPGNTVSESLITCKISGVAVLTGGQTGPQNSIQSLILCSMTALLFLWQAKKKDNFIKPAWKK